MEEVKKALIVVDVQRDFCEGGSLEVKGGAEVAKRISQYITTNNAQYEKILATKDWHVDPRGHFSDDPDYINTWPPHCVVNTEGAEFHPNFNTDMVDTTFYKGLKLPAYSGFEGYDFDHTPYHLNNYLLAHGIRELDICGIATDYCVKATVIDALEYHYDTTVLGALCAAVDEHKGYEAIAQMQDKGAKIVII